MLRQHVQPARPRRIAVQLARGDAEYGRLAFQHLEAVGRHQDGAGCFVHPVIGAPHALQQPRHALRCADLDHLVHSAPIDAEIERRGRHHGAQLSSRHRRLDAAALLHLQRAVMQRDRQRRLVQPPQRLEHQLRLGARVDEHDRHAGLADARHHARCGIQSHVAGPGQFALGQHHREFGRRPVRLLDHPVGADIGADRRGMRHRRRQPDAAARRRQRHQPRDA